MDISFGDGTQRILTEADFQRDAQGRYFEIQKTYLAGDSTKPFTVGASVVDEGDAYESRYLDVQVKAATPRLAEIRLNGVPAKAGSGIPFEPNATLTLPVDGGQLTITGYVSSPVTTETLTLLISWDVNNPANPIRTETITLGPAETEGPYKGWYKFTATELDGGINRSSSDPFVHRIYLEVSSTNGEMAGQIVEVELPNPAPVMRSFTVTPTSALEGGSVTYKGTFTFEGDPADILVQAGWGDQYEGTITVERDATSGVYSFSLDPNLCGSDRWCEAPQGVRERSEIWRPGFALCHLFGW